MSYLRVLGLLLFCASFNVKADVVRSEYYADFPFWESPLQALKMHSPLTPEQAKKRIHVEVGYDEFNRPIDIQLRSSETFKDSAPFWSGIYVHASRTKITYSDQREIHQFYNRFGTRVTGWGDVWEKVYTTDARGRYVRLDFFGKDGQPVQNSWGSKYYQWQYGKDGSVVEERFSAAGELMPHRPGFEFKRIRLFYGPDGHLALMQNIDENGALVASASGAAQYRYFYDSLGMFDRWEVYDTDGNPALGPTGTAGEQYTNGVSGFKEIAFFDKEGARSLHASGAAYWRGKYDPFGNMSELSFYGVNDEPVIGLRGFHKHRLTWSHDGQHLMQRDFIGLNGEPINAADGISRIAYERDDVGQLTALRFFDANGNPAVSSYERAAAILYSYDSGGVRTNTVRLGLDGEPVPDTPAQ